MKPKFHIPDNSTGDKCAIVGCPNRKNEGIFIGNICSPCFEFLVNMKTNNSYAYKVAKIEEEKNGRDKIQRKNKLRK